MGWYDLFARFYDKSLEPLYAEQRALAAEALALSPGLTVLDLPCGTGLSFDVLAPAVGAEGKVYGVDLSPGMLAQARLRAERNRWAQVELLEQDVLRLDPESVGGGVNRLHVFLGMTAFPDPEAAFERLWALIQARTFSHAQYGAWPPPERRGIRRPCLVPATASPGRGSSRPWPRAGARATRWPRRLRS